MDVAVVLFALGAGFLFAHELDAVRCREWRMHPLFSWIKGDESARAAFVAAHVPVLALLVLAFSTMSPAKVIFWLDLFFVLHGLLHVCFLAHPRNEFRDSESWLHIFGSAICGAAALTWPLLVAS